MKYAQGHETRSEIDLRVGLTWTVFQSKFLNKIVPKNMNVNQRFSYGPCLFPTLYFCVQKAFEIIKFQSKRYWRIVLKLLDENNNEIEVEHVTQFKSYQEANQILKKIRGTVILDSRTTIENVISKPKPLNTTQMLKLSSLNLSMNSTETASTAQHLYEEGYISYPRSEGCSYSKNMMSSLKSTVNSLAKREGGRLTQNCKNLLKDGFNYDASDDEDNDENHPPITPVDIFKNHKKIFPKDKNKFNLYVFITNYFLASLSSDCTYAETTSIFTVNSENFKYVDSVITSEGFLKYYEEPKSQITNIQKQSYNLPVGSKMGIKEMRIEELTEIPPDYLSEAELIELMEKHGIGTDGTIPKTIRNLKFRKYLEVPKKKKGDNSERIKPTLLGLSLAIGYLSIDPELIEPKIRKFIENCNQKVSTSELKKDTVMDIVYHIFSEKLENFSHKIQKKFIPVIKRLLNKANKYELPTFDIGDKQKVRTFITQSPSYIS